MYYHHQRERRERNKGTGKGTQVGGYHGSLRSNSPILSIYIIIINPLPPQTRTRERERERHSPISLDKIPEPLRQLQFLIIRINRKILIRPNSIISHLLQLELLVKAVEHRPKNEAPHNSRAKHGERDGVAAAETVCGKTPNIRARDIPDLRKGVYHGDRDGTLGGRARERRRDPGVEDDEAGVGAGLQEEGDVAGGDDFGRHADYEADHAHADWADDVPELDLSC
jgi:hypothetical protein